MAARARAARAGHSGGSSSARTPPRPSPPTPRSGRRERRAHRVRRSFDRATRGPSPPWWQPKRLARDLGHAGVAWRRGAETVIAGGRVSVDGEIVLDPARDVGEHNRVTVDGRILDGAEIRVSYALHQPLGVGSTASD